MIKSFEVPKENCKKMVMSSLEIAKATGKMHKHIIRDIRTMEEAWEKVTGTKFGLSEYKDKTGRKLPCYILKYDECMYVASKWNDETRAKLVKRWKDLESQRIAEEKNPDISVSKAIKAYKKQGKSDAWIANRFSSTVTRNSYTKVLQNHDVQRFGTCTDEIYLGLFGARAKTIKKEKGLPEKSNLRDNMSMVQLSSIMLAEALATENIEQKDIRGDNGCAKVSRISADNVAEAVEHGRKQLGTH